MQDSYGILNTWNTNTKAQNSKTNSEIVRESREAIRNKRLFAYIELDLLYAEIEGRSDVNIPMAKFGTDIQKEMFKNNLVSKGYKVEDNADNILISWGDV